MESERWNGSYVEKCIGCDTDRMIGEKELYDNTSEAMSCKVFPVPSPSASSSFSPVRFIEHPVSKMDTLAGVAIKYGVEVADIRKMNGLVTDRQMFALKTLHIPLPGRHPPSHCLSNGSSPAGPSISEQTPSRRHSDFLESFRTIRVTPEKKVSPAMSSLQGYYRLKPAGNRTSCDGFEMAVYSKENGPFPKPAPSMNPPLSLHRKSRSLANGFTTEDSDQANDMPPCTDAETWIEKLVRRHQKSEADFTCRTPEKLLKEENSSSGWFSAIAGKGLALRTKAASRTNLASEGEGNGTNASPSGPVDSAGSNGLSGFRKSSSTPSLQDQDNNCSSLIWPASKWNLKPDLQALSTSAIAKPIFDGLSKPITGRKNKAALD
ncbi:hypothetical protein Ancab_029938 [Ancistrocladus abbreviatus]